MRKANIEELEKQRMFLTLQISRCSDEVSKECKFRKDNEKRLKKVETEIQQYRNMETEKYKIYNYCSACLALDDRLQEELKNTSCETFSYMQELRPLPKKYASLTMGHIQVYVDVKTTTIKRVCMYGAFNDKLFEYTYK